MSEAPAHPSVISLLDDIRELEALVAQYRDSHREREQLRAGSDADCHCGLCSRAEGLGIPAVNLYLEPEDAEAELGAA